MGRGLRRLLSGSRIHPEVPVPRTVLSVQAPVTFVSFVAAVTHVTAHCGVGTLG